MEQETIESNRGLFSAIVSDGRPLLALLAVSLMLSGGFALFLCVSGHFLPHDVHFLGMDKEQLCGIHQCRIVHFMFHDRVSFGGALIAIGWLYLWLVEFPLRAGECWAWWAFLLSGITGFGSFLAYLGYGYLDSWHGIATLFLLPVYLIGMILTWQSLRVRRGPIALFRPAVKERWRTRFGIGRGLLLATAGGMMAGGLTILFVGMTSVFVSQDLQFMRLKAADLNAINPRLIPLIAHDRAGFGGGVATCGLILFFCVWCGRPSRSLWQAITLAGATGFATAIGVHPAIGYIDAIHLAPALLGLLMFIAGVVLCRRRMFES
jgi:hypothetical protein